MISQFCCYTCGELYKFPFLLPLQRKRDCETRITHSACQLINEGNKQNPYFKVFNIGNLVVYTLYLFCSMIFI